MTKAWDPIVAASALMVLCAGSAPPGGGTISIEPTVADASGEGSGPGVVEGVAGALGAHGFTILKDAGHSAMIASVSLTRTDVGTGSARVANGRAVVTPGLFGAAGGGVTVPLSARRTRSVPLQRIRLTLEIRRRVGGAVLWSGAAVTVRTADGRNTDEIVAASLSEAALRGYPDEPQGVVSVP